MEENLYPLSQFLRSATFWLPVYPNPDPMAKNLGMVQVLTQK